MNQRKLKLGIEHLRASDRKLGLVIERVGPCQLKVDSNHFWMLARAIVAQQISSAAARTITQRVRDLMKEELTAASLSGLPDEALRSAGVSKQKIGYLRSLTELYRISEDAPLEKYHKVASKWQPYASIASWYCWRLLEEK